MTAVTQEVDDGVVRSILDQVWESLLQAPARPWTGPDDRLGSASTVLTAEIALTGDWTGVVRLVCDPATARSLAAAMLGAGADEDLPDADVQDAVGEVVNVVGGNVKGTLVGTTTLGLPRVVEGGPRPGGGAATRCVVGWAGGPVVVEVVPDRPGSSTHESTARKQCTPSRTRDGQWTS